MGIEDLRNDERIDYIPGKQSIVTIKEVVDEGEFELGFMLFPTDISEIKELADNNLIMPPKSTYIDQSLEADLSFTNYNLHNHLETQILEILKLF